MAKGININAAIESAKEKAANKGLRGREFRRFVERTVNRSLRKTGKFRGELKLNWDSAKEKKPPVDLSGVVIPGSRAARKSPGASPSTSEGRRGSQ